MPLVTLPQAKTHLRLTEDDEDGYVEALIGVATAHIETVCGSEFNPDAAAQQHAALLLVGHWFRTRSGVAVGVATSELPIGVESLLRPYMLAF